jgi:hypothetical protein
MLYPNAKRLDPSGVKQFFKEQIKPRLPRSRAMPNDGEPTLLGKAFNDETADLLASNIHRTILLSF